MATRALEARFVQRTICIVLTASMASAPSLNVLAEVNEVQPKVRQPKPAAPSGMIDTTCVTPGAVIMAVLRPAQLMKSKAGEMLPVEVATAAGPKYLGHDNEGRRRKY